MNITTGAIQHTSAPARDVTVRLHKEESSRVKLTEASTESSPAKAKNHWSCPISISTSVTIEYIIWIEDFVHSHPNSELAVRI